MPNLPADVERYVQEGLDAGMPEDKAWAIAWSRWCKYKKPGSPHCKQGPEGYFTGKGRKTASFTEVWALVSTDGYMFGIADMPNAMNKDYWLGVVGEDDLGSAYLAKLVDLPPHLHDRLAKYGFDDGFSAWEAAKPYAEGGTSRVAGKSLVKMKGKLPPQRDPAARAMILNPPSGGGAHRDKSKYDRADKHKGRDRGEYMEQPLSLRPDYGSLDSEWGDTIYDA